MFEEFAFVLVVLLVIIIILAHSVMRSRLSEGELRLKISSARESISIAERKFMQRKIKKGIFEALADQLEEELLFAELALFRLNSAPLVSVAPKAEKLFAVLERPTGYRKAKISSILKKTELLRHEMRLLEGKLLKREINQRVFEKLIAQKESELIQKEKELTSVVVNSNGPQAKWDEKTSES